MPWDQPIIFMSMCSPDKHPKGNRKAEAEQSFSSPGTMEHSCPWWPGQWSWTARSPRTWFSRAAGCPEREPIAPGRSSSWQGPQRLRGPQRCGWRRQVGGPLPGHGAGTLGAAPDPQGCRIRGSSSSWPATSSSGSRFRQRRRSSSSATIPGWMRLLRLRRVSQKICVQLNVVKNGAYSNANTLSHTHTHTHPRRHSNARTRTHRRKTKVWCR